MTKDTSFVAEVRASDTVAGLSGATYAPVGNGGSLPGLAGRFAETRVTMKILSGEVSPILYDLSVQWNQAPDCSKAAASIGELWPPDHKFVPITITGVTDPDDDPITISIFQDEPVTGTGQGAGNTTPDGGGIGTNTARVRAERNGNPTTPGNGRVYHIKFIASDGQGGTCGSTVKVCVPHDQRPGTTCVDDGPKYDSTGK